MTTQRSRQLAKVDAISVIMTDAEMPFANRTLHSAVSQDHIGRVIVVYNQDLAWMKDVIQRFRNTVHFLPTQKICAAAARNLGVKSASSDYIAFLDGDDCWMPNKTRLQLQLLQSSDADLVGSDHALVDVEGKRFAYGLCRSVAMTSSWMAKRDLFIKEPFNETWLKDEDAEWWVRCFFKYKIIRLPDLLVEYTVRPGSLSSDSVSKRRKEAILRYSNLGLIRRLIMLTTYVLRIIYRRDQYIARQEWQSV